MRMMKTRMTAAVVAKKKSATQRVSGSWGEGAVPFEPVCLGAQGSSLGRSGQLLFSCWL